MLIGICLKRFYSVNFLTDVINHFWTGDLPENIQIGLEVTMTGFGNVDFVIADVTGDDEIAEFLSVEL
ncbi:MAG: hypothetical protein OXE78_04795 [Gammaproteobacteria bacterium]|nr:hypothetical protein [Gammaproteobacteria bacterium]MCY4358520.1 hypothetical protein [Gammaproteobacteria bacterium]